VYFLYNYNNPDFKIVCLQPFQKKDSMLAAKFCFFRHFIVLEFRPLYSCHSLIEVK